MPANEYHFVSHWRVESTVEEVSDVLDNAPDLARTGRTDSPSKPGAILRAAASGHSSKTNAS
jgi:hypothetical protein